MPARRERCPGKRAGVRKPSRKQSFNGCELVMAWGIAEIIAALQTAFVGPRVPVAGELWYP